MATKKKESATTLSTARTQYVAKSNQLIQRTTYSLPINEQKMLLYMISMVKPNDIGETEYVLNLKKFCAVAGIRIDEDGGYYYTELKRQIKHLADSSIWITNENGSETLMRWLDQVVIKRNSGEIRIRFHESVRPHLFELQSHYTQFRLQEVLLFRSRYSVRLYELLRSYAFGRDFDNGQERQVEYTPEHLRYLLGTKSKVVGYDASGNPKTKQIFKQWGQFKTNVIKRGIEEINTYSQDMHVEFEEIKEGNKVVRVLFYVTMAHAKQALEAHIIRKVKFDLEEE